MLPKYFINNQFCPIQRYLIQVTKVKSKTTSYMAIFAYKYYTTIRKLR
nr:MAG TPA: hypothetical protein [Caudoviricetes sp.]